MFRVYGIAHVDERLSFRRFQVPTLARLKGRSLVDVCSDVCSLGAEYKRERTKISRHFWVNDHVERISLSLLSVCSEALPRGKDLSLLSVCSEALFGLELDG